MKATKSNQMSDAEKIRFAKNEYQKAWRAKNPEKAKQIQDKTWLKRFQKLHSQEDAKQESLIE